VKKMKKVFQKRAKLTLSVETLRLLEAREHRAVVGASGPSCDSGTSCNTTTN